MLAFSADTSDLEQQLEQLQASVSEQVLRDAALAGAEVLAAEVRLRAPTATGTLRVAISAQHLPSDGSRRQVAGVVIDGKAWYYKFIEWGRSYARPVPFIRPSLDSKGAEALTAMRKVIEDAVNGNRS